MRILRPLAPITFLFLLATATSCSKITTDAVDQSAEVAAQSVYSLDAVGLDGEPAPLSKYEGEVTLIVNTASKCGYTPQYAGLEMLQSEYGPRGFTVLGFPSGDFMGQEFDTAAEIRQFCDSRYAVSFPLFEKSGVKEGDGQSPIYAFLGEATGSLPGWNFGKYLVGRDGRVVAFYATPVEPTSDELRGAIEAALAVE